MGTTSPCECVSSELTNGFGAVLPNGNNCTEENLTTCGEWDEVDWDLIAFSACTSSCGGNGVRIKERCFTWFSDGIEECETLQEDCGLEPCPGWGNWTNWSPCSANCRDSSDVDAPTQSRTKCWFDGAEELCDNCGEDTCELTEVQNCNDEICIVGCEFGEWGDWEDCVPDC